MIQLPHWNAGWVVALVAACATASAQQPRAALAELPGLRADGSVLLPNQWSLRPAGRQIQMGDFPVNIALHPTGQFAAVLHCGYARHEVRVVDIPAAKVVSQTPVNEAF